MTAIAVGLCRSCCSRPSARGSRSGAPPGARRAWYAALGGRRRARDVLAPALAGRGADRDRGRGRAARAARRSGRGSARCCARGGPAAGRRGACRSSTTGSSSGWTRPGRSPATPTASSARLAAVGLGHRPAPAGAPGRAGLPAPAAGWQELALRVLPLAMVGEYSLISGSGLGTFPFHSLQGMSLPLAILAVAGARRAAARRSGGARNAALGRGGARAAARRWAWPIA